MGNKDEREAIENMQGGFINEDTNEKKQHKGGIIIKKSTTTRKFFGTIPVKGGIGGYLVRTIKEALGGSICSGVCVVKDDKAEANHIWDIATNMRVLYARNKEQRWKVYVDKPQQ